MSTRAVRFLSRLRPSERRVAHALLADYPSAGLDSAARLATVAGVSAPTVLRFAQSLGFSGYAELQDALRRELTEQAHAPMHRLLEGTDLSAGTLAGSARQLANEAAASIGALAAEEIDRLVELLADTRRRIFLTGGRTSRVLSMSLAENLQQIRPEVRSLDDPFGDDLALLLDLHRRDVHLILDFERYSRASIAAAAESKSRGAVVILVTDEQLSPAAVDASLVLPVRTRSSSPFGSLVAATILTELVVPLVLERLGPPARQRYREWDEHHGQTVIP